jgi:Tfp pilus assembly protein PilE
VIGPVPLWILALIVAALAPIAVTMFANAVESRLRKRTMAVLADASPRHTGADESVASETREPTKAVHEREG